jgi:hypothetical protein
MKHPNTVQHTSYTGAKELFTHPVLLYDKEQLVTVPALKESSMTGEMSFAAVRILRSASCLIPLSSFRKESVFITSRITLDAGSSWVKQLQGNKTAISNNLNLVYIFLCILIILKQTGLCNTCTGSLISLQGLPVPFRHAVLHQDPFNSFIITPSFASDSF